MNGNNQFSRETIGSETKRFVVINFDKRTYLRFNRNERRTVFGIHSRHVPEFDFKSNLTGEHRLKDVVATFLHGGAQ
jgi:hypothetical protein